MKTTRERKAKATPSSLIDRGDSAKEEEIILGFVIVILIIAALLAAIYGRGTAQAFVKGTAGTVLFCFLGFCVVVGMVDWQMTHQSAPAGSATSYSSPTGSALVSATSGPKIGIALEPINAANAGYLHIPVGYGIYVGSVTLGGPADMANIQRGDFIEQIDGQWLTSQNQLPNYLAQKGNGQYVTLLVVHNWQARNVAVQAY